MSILWAANEPEGFFASSAITSAFTTSSDRDPDFARAGFDLTNSTPTRINSTVFGDIPEAWFHYRWGASNIGGESQARTIVEFRNSSGQGVLRLQQIASTSPNKNLEYWNGSAWTAINGSPLSIATSLSPTFDIQCKVDGVDGRFALYVNGALEAELTGDTDFFSGSAIDSVFLGNWGNTNGRRASEAIISTTNTLSMRLATVVATGNGANTAWTGDYTAIDEVTISDSDLITSGTNDQIETFTFGDLSATAQLLAPVAVINSMRARNAASGPQNIQSAVRISSTDYFSSDLSGITTSFQNGFQVVYELNPATSAAWTVSEVNALEMGVRSRA